VIKACVDVLGKHSGMEKHVRSNVMLVSLATELINAEIIRSIWPAMPFRSVQRPVRRLRNDSCDHSDTSSGFSPQICSMNKTVLVLQHNTSATEPYNFRSVNFLAISNSLTVTFALEDSGNYWLLDNIALINVNESVDVLLNGDFENGNLTKWNYCNPNSSPSASRLANGGPYYAKNGSQYYYGGPTTSPDYLSQTIGVKETHLYRLSFWLGHTGASVRSSFRVTISY
jgi:hypothetical protein